MSLLGLCQSSFFIQYKNYQKSLCQILESVFSFLVLFVVFSLCHIERERSIYVFFLDSKFFIFFIRGRDLNLQVWISAYARMRSRLILPLIPLFYKNSKCGLKQQNLLIKIHKYKKYSLSLPQKEKRFILSRLQIYRSPLSPEKVSAFYPYGICETTSAIKGRASLFLLLA